MAEQDFEWFLSHQDAYDSLTIEQLHELGRGGTVEYGDTEPAEPVVAESDEAPAVEVEEQQEPVVLAKDGKNTIPFSELESARAKATELEALSKDQAALIEELRTAKQSDKGTGETVAQDEVMAKLVEQYPELATTLVPILESLKGGSEVAALKKELAELRESLTPLKQSAENNSLNAHFDAIHAAIPDFDEIVASGKVQEWVKTLPSYAQAGANAVLEKGTADEVIELFGQYKGAPAPSKPALTKQQLEAEANKAIAKAKKPAIHSLTDIPAAATNGTDEEPTTAEGWSRYFAGKSPEQINKILASN